MERMRTLTTNRLAIGYLLIVVSTVCYSVNNNLAKESYAHGVSVDTMLVSRSWAVALLLGGWCLIRGGFPVVPRGTRRGGLFAAAMFPLNAWSLLNAFDLMPVSLAILVFYLFPFLVAVLAAILRIESLKPVMLIGLIVAFVGLVLTLQSSGELNAQGVGLSFIAALCISGNILVTGRILRSGTSPVSLAFWMMLGGAIVFSAKMALTSGPSWPVTHVGWFAIVGTNLFVGAASVTLYTALGYLSGARAALVMNLEPVLTIIIAVFLFAEPFGAYQWLGAAMVFAAIICVTVAGRRS